MDFHVLQDYDPYEENPGIAPFSEPEAQIMRELSRSFKPHIWVNVHSGMEVIQPLYSVDILYVMHNNKFDHCYDATKTPKDD